MSKRRIAALVASAAILTTAVPAAALAAPALPGPLANLQDAVGIHDNANNKTRACHADWNSTATKKLVDGKVVNTINGGVSPARGDNGVTEVQLWGGFDAPHWRTVVATDSEISHYKFVVTLPAGYTYTTSVKASTDKWFAVDLLDNRTSPVKWTKAVGPEGLTVTPSNGGRTLTVTVKSGPLKGLDRFVIEYAGTPAGATPDAMTATARSTGTLTQCAGSFGSS